LRGYQKDGVVDKIREVGGEIYAITSEPHSLAKNAQLDRETGFEHIGDPHHEILEECTKRGWLSLFLWEMGGKINDESTSWVSHPKGHFQPGVLALTREERVLYRWQCRRNRKNLGGAWGRPTADYVWSNVQEALRPSSDPSDAPLDEHADADEINTPWVVFLALLLANGWFLKPVFFDQRTGNNPKDTVAARAAAGALRCLLFLAGWITAFALLPFWIPGLALAGWIAMVAPKINRVNKGFQNVRPGEEPV
jgi:hypothetical protein